MKRKKPFIPAERDETVRRRMVSLLCAASLSARDISAAAGISEKEVYAHLAHIQRTIHRSGKALVVTAARCRNCGFEFRKRERLKRPGRCPVCRGESMEGPFFSIR